MDPVTKNKSLIAIIVFLLVSNIAMLIFFIVLSNPNKSGHGRKEMISTFLKNDIGFSKDQLDQYEKIHKIHWDNFKPYIDSVRNAKDSFYKLLYTSPADSEIMDAASKIGPKQVALDVNMFHHLQDVRSLCTPEQRPKFDSTFNTVISRMTGRARKGDSKGK